MATKSIKNYARIKETLDKMSLTALNDRTDLIESATDHLKSSILSADFSSDGVVDDLKTWVSAAITYEHTCIDGLADAAGEPRVRVAELMRNSTEFTSNSLAILSEVSHFKFLRLPSHKSDELPSWVSHHDRRLLESLDQLREKADAVVAKDGSGQYMAISEALAEAPEKSERRFVIYVKKGTYYENVRVEKSKWNVVMVGDGMDAAIVSASLNFVDGTPTYSTATFVRPPVLSEICHLILLILLKFYRDCNIYGTVDFIFGNAAVIFQSCNILPRLPMPGQQDTIAAQGKADPNQNTGIVIHNCTVWPDGDLSSVNVYLGRPWKAYSTMVYMRTAMHGFIDPAGWLPWNGTTAPDTIFYSEYRNFGAGAGVRDRVKWKGLRAMDGEQAAKFTVGGFLGGSSWISKAGVPCLAGL